MDGLGTNTVQLTSRLKVAALPRELPHGVRFQLMREQGNLNKAPAHLSEGVSVETLDVNRLPKDWRTHAGREALQTLGGEWLRQSRSCVLVVPSAVMPAELNFLINPMHPDIQQMVIGKLETLETDMRLS